MLEILHGIACPEVGASNVEVRPIYYTVYILKSFQCKLLIVKYVAHGHFEKFLM